MSAMESVWCTCKTVRPCTCGHTPVGRVPAKKKRLCSNRPQANQSRWIPYIHYNRPQTGRRAAFDRSPRARRPLTVKSRPARDLAGRDRNLRMRSALLLRVSSLYRSTQSRNRMSITSKFDPHHSPSHHTTSRSYADCYLKSRFFCRSILGQI